MGVYFICDEQKTRVKIGFTRFDNAQDRLVSLQTGSADRLTVARFLIDAGQEEEKAFHRYYSRLHMGGEWFRFCESMLTLILTVSDKAILELMPRIVKQRIKVVKPKIIKVAKPKIIKPKLPSVPLKAMLLRVPRELRADIDLWRGRQAGVPSRNEAIRRILLTHLDAEGVRLRKGASRDAARP